MQLKRLAETDSLTGLGNRHRFALEINKLIQQKSNQFALAITDVDNFKDINDTLGHYFGDKFLISFAERLRKCASKHVSICRLGGDEFAILISGYDDKQEVIDQVNEIIRETKKTFIIDNTKVISTISVGVTFYPFDGFNTQALLKNADMAMYAAKRNGRNKIRYYHDDLSQVLKEQFDIRNKLQSAVYNDEFELYYQPKFSTKLNKVTGFEALIRWHQPELGFIPPDKFISEAESNGSIIDIGHWVLHTACKQAKQWHDCGLLHDRISVNASAIQLLSEGYLDSVLSVLNDTGLPAEKLEIEITESIFLKDLELTQYVLRALQSHGITTALDDFGTGFSSLSYFNQLAINTLKIDRSFIKNIEHEQQSVFLIQNIFNLARDFNMNVVCEGVENKTQLDIVCQYHQCDIQGYFFSPPVKSELATHMLEKPYLLSSNDEAQDLSKNSIGYAS